MRVGRNAGNSSLGEALTGGRMHAGRFAALRCRYTIVRAARAAAPRDGTHAGRASNGRSEAASASADPYSKTRFYRIILVRVDATVTVQWAFLPIRGESFERRKLRN
ncbi:hypothetical protein GCM10027093_47500 [Paraburkholderia jirisanensis]